MSVDGTYFEMMHQISLVNLVTLPLYNVHLQIDSRRAKNTLKFIVIRKYCQAQAQLMVQISEYLTVN